VGGDRGPIVDRMVIGVVQSCFSELPTEVPEVADTPRRESWEELELVGAVQSPAPHEREFSGVQNDPMEQLPSTQSRLYGEWTDAVQWQTLTSTCLEML